MTAVRAAPRDATMPTTWGRTHSTTPRTACIYVTVRALENYFIETYEGMHVLRVYLRNF